ncbi:MAG: PKD domain-containing protein [Bacteroidota bacterium]|nr:PKD domain-containing protein [Bacteroidota bacterium]
MPVSACAPFTINLNDNSPATSSWNWDFGDGTASTLANPVHTYTTGGTYNVVLQTQSSGTNCSQLVNPFGTYIINSGEAGFDLTQTLCPPFTATFTDQSVNAVAWFWDFGDGTTSTLQNPVHVYSNPGSYNVSLTITTSDGCSYTEFHNYAVTFLPLIANATAVTTDSVLPLTVNFSANSSGATAWYWEFGDGNTSTLQNPVNIYTIPGPYNIMLVVSNGSCADTITYTGVTFGMGTVLPGDSTGTLHVPDPVYSCVPYEMNFNNPALNTVAWLWNFGDGTTSNLENPVHIYTDPGVYTVSLVTWDAQGVTDTIVQPSPFYLTGSSADFQLSYANNCQGSTISIINTSINAISWNWDFGDGTTSNLENPQHVYSTVGINYIVSLTVTDSAGCTDYMARSYYAAGGNSVQASTRRLCAGDTVSFTNGAMNFSSYLWDFGDGTTATGTNPTHVYADSGSFQVSLTVTDSLGCVTTFDIPYLITVSKPVADFSYTIISQPCFVVMVEFQNLSTGADSYVWDFGYNQYSSQVNPTFGYTTNAMHSATLIASSGGCSDTHTVSNFVYSPWLRVNFSYTQSSDCFPITATYADSSMDAISWLWNFGDGDTSTLQNPVHVFTSKPAFPVTLTVRDIYGCVKTVSKPNINAMTLVVSATDTIGCSPHLVTLTDSSVNVASWLWDFGDGTTSSLSDPSHVYATNGNFNISLTATSVSGCTQVFNSLMQVTATGPQAQFSLNSLVSCAPTIVNFYDNSVDVDSWIWNFGDGNQSVVENPVHIYNQPGTYDVSLTVIDSAGCTDTLSLPAIVHITGSVASFAVSGTTGCSPWQVQFQDSSISAFSWSWNFGDGNISTQQNPLHTYNTPGNYVVTLMTEDTTGCLSVYSSPVPLNVQQPPVSLFTMSDSSGCAPFSVTMNNLSGNGLGYTWNFGDGSTSAAMHATHVYTNPGTYYVMLEVLNSNGCKDTMTASVPVTVGATPSPAFTVNTFSGCNPLPVQFTNTTLNADSTTSYFWNFGNGTYSGVANPYQIYSTAGVYSVTLTATNIGGCSASVTQNNLVIVSNGEAPPPVAMKSVSVLDDNTMEVTWGNLALQDLAAYKLYRYNDLLQAFVLVHADNNPNNSGFNVVTTYVDSVPGTTIETYTYLVQAINTCGFETPLNLHVPHTSINIEDTIINNQVRLDWNYYDGCAVGSYQVFRQDNTTGSFNLVGTVSANMNYFIDSTIYCGMLAAYRVKAIDLCGEGFEAWSDIEIVQAPGSLLNQTVDVIRSTVIDDSFVFTEWSPPVQAPQLVTEFEVYRSTDNSNWTLLATVPAVETNYSDYDTRVKLERYFYRVKVKNICELQTSQGLPGTSILLVGGLDENNNSILRWSAYKNWDSGVDYYVIEKQDEYGNWVPIKTVDGNILDYIDR